MSRLGPTRPPYGSGRLEVGDEVGDRVGWRGCLGQHPPNLATQERVMRADRPTLRSVLICGLAMILLPAVPAGAHAGPPNPVAPRLALEPAPPAESNALAEARRTGQRVEVLGLRTEVA